MQHRDGSLKDNDDLRDLPMACADEQTAVEMIERKIWGKTPCCPRCGDTDVYQMRDRATGERNRRWLWRCRGCKRQYTVRINTIFQDSKIPLRHWCYALWQMSAAKKGVSALQIRRMTGLSYKSALFMMHRIRWAMNETGGGLLGGPGKTLEADETWVGGKPRNKRRGKYVTRSTTKVPVMALVERGGNVRMQRVARVTSKDLGAVLLEYADPRSRLMTDEHLGYKKPGKRFDAGHFSVMHSAGEYARGDHHSNTVESVFSLLKRGLMGTFHSVSKHHLHRYLSEFEFRWNTRVIDDGARFSQLLTWVVGKRLRYATSQSS